MVNYRNENATGHILTIEDPVEFLHTHKKSVVDQREVGLDTLSYEVALKNAMREAPDVILIGEIRDRHTMQHAIAYAETGHLCLSTLHANNANQALDRIINFFPDSAHHQLYMDLSLNLKAVVSQRLIKSKDGKRVPAVEIMLLSTFVAELIQKGDIHAVKEAMEQGNERGMQTFDQALYKLYKEGRITLEEALANADSRNNLSLRIRLDESGKVSAAQGLQIHEEEFF
jgi:twitching motility protein PilU